jgi:hypothetical protein
MSNIIDPIEAAMLQDVRMAMAGITEAIYATTQETPDLSHLVTLVKDQPVEHVAAGAMVALFTVYLKMEEKEEGAGASVFRQVLAETNHRLIELGG